MSDFIVSARKYRPSTFESVVGQDALTTTLRNAILTNKLSHAYLFCGPRGVGKTSCARIFAKTINCENRTASGDACNQCESCKAANEQRSYNITELDAASNNSVQDIRQLIEQVYIAPTTGKYRVYIIDEVHMLSSSAFNAFLKTLEEPPAHAIFVLATTEKHKVLPTIISRCQVHDFSRITSLDIANHLQKIAQAEHIIADPDALQMIGIAADGGMRDALSMFDQIAGFGGGQVTIDGVRQNLNLLAEDEYFSLLGYILLGSHAQVLNLIDKLLRKGYEGDIIMKGFSGFLRNVLLSQSPDTLNIIEAPQSIKDRMIKAGQYTPMYLLWEFLKISTNFSSQYKGSNDKRLILEVALLEMCEKVAGSQLQAPPASSNPPQPQAPMATPQPSANTSTSPRAAAPSAMPPQTTPTPPPSQVNTTAPQRDPDTVKPQAPTQNNPQVGEEEDTSKRVASGNKKRYAFNLVTGQKVVEEQESGFQKPTTQRTEPFTQEQMLDAWRVFANSRKGMSFKMMDRQNNPPKLLANHLIQYQVFSITEKDQIEGLLPELKQELSDALQNDLLEIRIEYNPDNTPKSTPLTPFEKFELLKEENPWINRLVTDLDLSFNH